MSRTIKALAALLGYPSAELQQHVGEVREALRPLPGGAQARLEPLLQAFERDELLDLQSAYSELFDRSRALSLHLFEHVHGDSRERGQAMIDLSQQYVERGFMLDTNELPDFVPVFLEYAAFLPPSEAQELLRQPAHVFAALAERLDKRRSSYAGVFHALLAIAAAKPDADAVAELDKRTPAEDPARIDQEWEEAPVTFLAAGAAHDMGGPTGAFAKLRAATRATSKEGER